MAKDRAILFTGGHAGSTAHAVISKLRKDIYFQGYKIYFIGAKSAIEGKKINTLEKSFLPGLGVEYIAISAARLQRRLSIWTIPAVLKFPFGLFSAFFQILKIKPSITVSFGGFVSFPVIFSSWLLKIPVVIHEQTSGIGLANKLSLPFASLVLLSRKQSLGLCGRAKTKIIGNPVLEDLSNIKVKSVLSSPPTIFITGGSRGSKRVNDVIFQALRELTNMYKIIHQTGNLDYTTAQGKKKKLGFKRQKNYEPVSVVSPERFNKILKKADLVISRSGANTVSAIMCAKKLSILIPLPFSQSDEQLKNAIYAKEYGYAFIIKQKDLTPRGLLKAVDNLINNYKNLINKFLPPDVDDAKASTLFIDELKNILNGKKKND